MYDYASMSQVIVKNTLNCIYAKEVKKKKKRKEKQNERFAIYLADPNYSFIDNVVNI